MVITVLIVRQPYILGFIKRLKITIGNNAPPRDKPLFVVSILEKLEKVCCIFSCDRIVSIKITK